MRARVLFVCCLLGACGAEPQKQPELKADPPLGVEQDVANAEAEQAVARGEGFIAAGKFESARPELEKAIAKAPKYGLAYGLLAVVDEKAGKKDLALAGYRKAIELNPKLTPVYLNLAALLLEDPPKPDEAAAVLEKGIAEGADDAGVYENLGFARMLKEDYAGAAKAYEIAHRKSGGHAQIALAYGRALVASKDRDKAAAVLVPGLAKAPEDAGLLASYAYVLGSARAFADCVKALDRALKLKPNEAELLTQRGLCKHETGKEPDALADYEAAVKANPKYVRGHLFLGMSLIESKKRERGLKELELAAKLGAGTELGSRAQAKIDELRKKKN